MNHMVAITDATGNRVDVFAIVTEGEVATLDLGRREVSASIDGITKQSSSRFNVRIVSKQGGNGKFFTTGDPVDDLSSVIWLVPEIPAGDGVEQGLLVGGDDGGKGLCGAVGEDGC